MSELFKVTIHTYEATFGYVEYNPDSHKITVHLADEAKKIEVEKYLSVSHTIRVAQNELCEFKEVTLLPSESLESLKLTLTRMWEATDVCVAWSRPVVEDC